MTAVFPVIAITLTAYSFLVVFPGLIMKNKLQKLYLYGTQNGDYTTNIQNQDIFCPLDGWFKEMRFVLTVTNAYSHAQTAFVNLYQEEKQPYFNDATDGTRRPLSYASFSSEAVYAFTQNRDFVPYVSGEFHEPGDISAMRINLSREVHTYDVFVVEFTFGQLQESTQSAGTHTEYWEITYVISPSQASEWRNQIEPLGLLMMANMQDAKSYFQMTLPSSGYLTNASIMFSSGTSLHNRVPMQMVITPDMKTNYLADMAMTEAVDMREMGSNAFEVTSPGTYRDVDKKEIFFHWGNQRVYCPHTTYLHFVCLREDSTEVTMVFQADFVPKRGAKFVQVTSIGDSTVSTSDHYERGHYFPVDQENVIITLTGNCTAKGGLIAFRLFQPLETYHSTIATQHMDADMLNVGGLSADRTTYSDSGILGILAVNVTTPIVNAKFVIPKVKAGSFFAHDVIRETEASLAFLYTVVVEGTVSKQLFSKSAFYSMATPMMDITPLIRPEANTIGLGGLF